MKNIQKIFAGMLFLGTALVVASCAPSEEDDLFDKSAAERLNDVAADYTKILAESEAGWIMEYYPTNDNSDPTGLGYLMLVDFNNDGFVKVGMMNSLTDGKYEENSSVWEVITDNGPVLSFSTYNDILHYFSNPAIYDQGNGYRGDYEFVMVDVPEDHQVLMLKGKKRGTYVRLTRLPEGTDFETYLTDVYNFQNTIFSSSAPNMDYMTLDGDVYNFADPSTTLPNIYLKGHDAIANEYHLPFLVTKQAAGYSLRFRTTLVFGEDNKGEQEFIYNESADKFYGVDNAENIIEGADPAEFFAETFDYTGISIWKLNKSSKKSDSAQALYDAAEKEFQDVQKYTLENAVIGVINNEKCLRLTCSYTEMVNRRPVKHTVNYLYDISVAKEGDNIAISYVGGDESSEAVLSTLPAVNTLVKTLAQQTYSVKATTTRFNLGGVTLTSTSDSNLWWAVTL